MTDGYRKLAPRSRRLAGVAVILVLIAYQGLAGSFVCAAPAGPVLKLTPGIDRYFLGSYIAYMEDPQNKLTINDVSSPQMSVRFVKHAGKVLNLGMNSSAYWIRFSVDTSVNQVSPEKWLLYFDWPNRIDYATLYIPELSDAGWHTREVGRILPTGLDPQPSTPVPFLPPQSTTQSVTFYLRVASSEAKILQIQVLTREAYEGVSRQRSLW